MNPTIIIVEDDLDIQQLLVDSLQNFGFNPIVCTNGMSIFKLFESTQMDLILLDVQLPDMCGFEVCKRIRKISNVPIIFISCLNDGSDIIHGLELGGDDYITKPFDLHQLIARIKSNLRRAPFFNRELSINNEKTNKEIENISIGNMKINFFLQKVYIDNMLVPLSHKEFQILSILAQNPNKTFSAHEIYSLIWGVDSLGETRTLKVHMSNLRKKLDGFSGGADSIRTIRGFGYQFSLNMNI